MSMFLKLNDDPDYINAVKVLYISPLGQDYEITFQGGKKIILPAGQTPWVATMCGFLVALKSGDIINVEHIVSIDTERSQLTLTMSDGKEFPLIQQEVLKLMGADEKENGEMHNEKGESVATHLNNRIAFLQSCGKTCENYKKL